MCTNRYPDETERKNEIFPVLDVPQTSVQLCKGKLTK